MTDTSKKTVEQEVCGPIMYCTDAGATMSEKKLDGILDIVRTLVRERDSMSAALAFLASRADDLSKDTIETLARQALRNVQHK